MRTESHVREFATTRIKAIPLLAKEGWLRH
jgi:hypothetical protein